MFSSFSSFQNPFVLPRFLGGNPGSTINVKPVEVHDVESQPEKRARTLKHLLKLNHANHSIIYHDLHFHNHMPHVSLLFIVVLILPCSYFKQASWVVIYSWSRVSSS